MNKNHIRGRHGGESWHNTAKPSGLAVEVNVADVRWRTVSLPGEISTARDRESGSAVRRNALGDRREVSRGHSTTFANRGDGRCPINNDTRKREHGKDRTDTMGRPGHPSRDSKPGLTVGGASGNRSRAEKESPCESVAVPKGEAADVRHLRLR
jgi:hypothetical protein